MTVLLEFLRASKINERNFTNIKFNHDGHDHDDYHYQKPNFDIIEGNY